MSIVARAIAGQDHVWAEGPGWGWSLESAESDALELLASIRPSWWDRAACRKADPSISFFQPEGSKSWYASVAAKAVCATCPVRNECYQKHVIETAEGEGVWAGFTPMQAQAERRRLGIRLTRGGYDL